MLCAAPLLPTLLLPLHGTPAALQAACSTGGCSAACEKLETTTAPAELYELPKLSVAGPSNPASPAALPADSKLCTDLLCAISDFTLSTQLPELSR